MEKDKKCTWKKTDTYISVSRNIKKEKKSHVELIKKNNVDTVYKVWQNSVKTYGDKNCLGTRQVFGEEDEQQKSGKVFKKLILGNYEWIDFNRADEIVKPFGAGLISLGLKGLRRNLHNAINGTILDQNFGIFSQKNNLQLSKFVEHSTK